MCWRRRRALADRTAPFALPALAVSDVHGFLALRETTSLSRRCKHWPMRAWRHLDPFRAPPSEAELGAPPPRQLDAAAGRDADALGLSLRVRDVVLPHDADAAADARRRRRCYQPAAEQYFARAVGMPRQRRPTSACSSSRRPASPSSSPSGCRCAAERGQEARRTDLDRRVVHHGLDRALPSGNATVRGQPTATSGRGSRGPRRARRAARTSGGAVISITRTGKRAAASAITPRETLATTTRAAARSAAISAGMP